MSASLLALHSIISHFYITQHLTFMLQKVVIAPEEKTNFAYIKAPSLLDIAKVILFSRRVNFISIFNDETIICHYCCEAKI